MKRALTSLKKKKYLYPIILILLIIMLNANAFAGTYYVDIGGDDNNSGTEESPWATLKKAAEEAKAGDTVFIKNGLYIVQNKISIESYGPITFQAFPGHEPTLKYIGNEAYFFSIGQNANNITVDGITFIRATNFDGNIISVGGRFAVITNCHIFFEDGYTPKKYDCIKIMKTGYGTTIENCEIYGAPNQGIDTVGGDNIVVRNNTIRDCQNAIVLKGGSENDLIENNRCYNCGYGAIGLGGTTDLQFINYLHENKNSIVRRNVIYYDEENNNNIGGGIFLQGASDCQVYNNTIIGAGIHIRCGGDPNNPLICSSQNKIYNNIIWRTGNDGILVVEPGNDMELEMNNNLYWKTTGSGEFKIMGQWYTYTEFKVLFDFDKNSLFRDPLLVDIQGEDFSLTSQSPCIDAGFRIPDEPFFGQQIDIGAIEAGLASPTNLRIISP